MTTDHPNGSGHGYIPPAGWVWIAILRPDEPVMISTSYCHRGGKLRKVPKCTDRPGRRQQEDPVTTDPSERKSTENIFAILQVVFTSPWLLGVGEMVRSMLLESRTLHNHRFITSPLDRKTTVIRGTPRDGLKITSTCFVSFPPEFSGPPPA